MAVQLGLCQTWSETPKAGAYLYLVFKYVCFSDSDDEKRKTSDEKRRKAPVKRKAPKSTGKLN